MIVRHSAGTQLGTVDTDMNKTQDGWVLLDKSDFPNFQNINQRKNLYGDVKRDINGWAIISFPDIVQNETKSKYKMNKSYG